MPRHRLSPERGHTFCASLCRRNALQDFASHFIWKLQVKRRRQKWAQNARRHRHFIVWACAVETHVKIWQKPLYAVFFCWKNAALQSEHPDQAPAFTAIARTLQCGHTVWRKIMDGNPHVTHIFLRVCLEIGHSKIQLYNWYHGF